MKYLKPLFILSFIIFVQTLYATNYPTLIWSTYFGGEDQDFAHAVTTDAKGNVYVTGVTSSTTGIANNQSFQQYYGGSGDIFIAKYSANGTRIWSTYFGGEGEDAGYAIALDSKGYVLVTGYVSSISGIATPGAHQTSFGSYRDAFVAKFSNDGQLIWATYLGGVGEDRGYGIACDGFDNVIVTGFTNSDTGIASQGAFQTHFSGGTGDDIFIAKFSSAGKRLWSTYMGGEKDDRGNALAIDKSGNIYITGITHSSSGIASLGSYQSVFEGNTSDAFIAKFSPEGKRSWSSYFGKFSQAHGIAIDKLGNGVITGDTYDSTFGSNFSSPGTFQSIYGGGNSDAFVASFSPEGFKNWSTYFGGGGDDYGYAVAIDDSNHIFITGPTNSQSDTILPGAYQRLNRGENDAYIAKFSADGKGLWNTFFGGKHIDISYGIAIDNIGNVIITGQTNSDSDIADRSSYQPVIAGKYDAFIAKFGYKYFIDAGINRFVTPLTSMCPGTYPVTVQLKNFGTKILDSVKIEWSVNDKSQKGYYWKGKLLPDSIAVINLGNIIFHSGNCDLRAWTERPNGQFDTVPQNDTALNSINVYPLPIASAGPDTILCHNQSYSMQGSGGVNYHWIPAKNLSSAFDPRAHVALIDSENYILIVRNVFGCIDTSQVKLKVRPVLQVKALASKQTICYGDPISLYSKAIGGDSSHYSFNWISDSLSGQNPNLKVYQSGWHKVILSDNCTPDSVSDSVYISVIPPAKADFSFEPNPFVKVKHRVDFMNYSQNASKYLWTFGNNDSSKLTSPQYIYADTGAYKIILVAYGLDGCANDTAFSHIDVLNNEFHIYVPNVFTPDNKSLNNIFEIKGYGIVAYSYSIYNRWGENLFNSINSETYWKGTFKNVPVPDGVYLYQLDVTDIDGDHHYQSGGITVLR